jgi:hemocyanin-like protein
MATLQELHDRTEAFLKRPPTSPPPSIGPSGNLEAMGPPPPNTRFVIFLPDHEQHALELTAKFMELSNAEPGEAGLEAVLEAAEQAAQTEDIQLVKYALMVFITHHPEGRLLPIPPLDERAPVHVVPSRAPLPPEVEALGGLGVEARLDYFREDTAVNDHHNKWHLVYPFSGIPNPANPQQRITKNRQGELFWYMHQQMLARYDTERLSVGLDPVAPFENYFAPILEGYEPNLTGYGDRAPNTTLADIDGYTVAEHEDRRQRLVQAAQNGVLQVGDGPNTVPISDPSLFSGTIESSVGSVNGRQGTSAKSFYGSLHNYGHVLIGDPKMSPTGGPGVMLGTDTALRDPVFYRWHRHVDDFFFTWQNAKLSPNDLSDLPEKVIIRKSLNGNNSPGNSPDILLCLQSKVQGATAAGFDGKTFGETTFGGANWSKAPSSFPVATNELKTTMRQETITLPDGASVNKQYLDHDEYYYFLRIENKNNQPRKVTVRIFLIAKQFIDDPKERRRWIEMDKFVQDLPASNKVVVFRPARLSSVVRKPAVRPSEPKPVHPPGAAEDAKNYCDCGWPYHLLLPRGDADGMDCRLLVMITDWNIDSVGADTKCGSMSFCGAKDADYPDKRAMGYPFDRPLPAGKTVSDIIADPQQTNMAALDFKIRFQ